MCGQRPGWRLVLAGIVVSLTAATSIAQPPDAPASASLRPQSAGERTAGIESQLAANAQFGSRFRRRARRLPRRLAPVQPQYRVVPNSAPATEPAVNANGAQPAAPAQSGEVTEEVRAVSASNNQFAFDLYQQLRSGDGNRFFSPASISTALAMTYAGATAETRQQMANVLHLDLPDAQVHQGFGALGNLLNAKSENYQLSLANRLWGQKDYRFEPAFLQTLHEHYGATLGEVDFAAAERARQMINQWVLENTNGKISDLIPADLLTHDTRLVVTNAIYFKGTWKFQFPPTSTRDDPFFLAEDRKIDVPMMHLTTADLRYAKVEDVQLLELPYVGKHLSMVILLPGPVAGLADLEKKLTADQVQQWIAQLEYAEEVEVHLPRFTFTSQAGLKDALSALGMPRAFSNEAQFAGISREKAQKLFDVLHQAYVDVNEQGTEAAAASGGISPDAPGPVPQTVVFKADHPFVFLIRDTRSEAILFLGRVVHPGQ